MQAAHTRILGDTPTSYDHARWVDLLNQLDPNALTDTFNRQVGNVPGYDPPPVPHSEIQRTGRLSFIALLNGLRDGGFREPLEVADDVGVSRARAGVDLNSLMTAIRLDFSILWEALTRVADRSDAELLVRHTAIVLRIVDEYAGQTQGAYLAEVQRMRDEEASVRQGLIARIFQDPSPTPLHLREISAELPLDPDAALTVAAATGDDIAPLRVFVSEAERAGAVMFTHHLGDSLVAFFRPLDLPGSRIESLGRRLLTLRVGLTAAEDGVSGLRQAASTARELALIVAPEEAGAMTWRRGWARLASRRLTSSGSPVLADVQAALDRCGAAERARLEESVRSYLRTGSVSDSARELFCHRNTIANRLRRFADLTDVDPAVPEQAARLVVGWA